jgi:hypothetical protein
MVNPFDGLVLDSIFIDGVRITSGLRSDVGLENVANSGGDLI